MFFLVFFTEALVAMNAFCEASARGIFADVPVVSGLLGDDECWIVTTDPAMFAEILVEQARLADVPVRGIDSAPWNGECNEWGIPAMPVNGFSIGF